MTLDEAWEILQNNHFKRTKNREMILRYLVEHDRYVTAMEVRACMMHDNPGISFDTIYRNLATFSELGIVEETELNGEKHFRFQCAPDVHHHHFICTVCGKTERISHCPMDFFPVELPGHVVEGHKFEIYGKCPLCKKVS